MKKKLSIILLSGITLATLSGCEEMNLHFEGKNLPESQIEEILEDRLEDENGLDLEVDITEEVE